eukprot:NODE_1310_length_1196_cov_74.784656_g1078_i0.p1 GENE.NODE_1310_length_1196_cov_74.784656_g1078_i0~~NODE_1310_length_1196_cov_74.784656_g1078_i0.p1  ORF type:complete len:252 (+),score=53.67 NODE_1310_length_1196_cov_74.784656_g1078_i0:339-1094(+)
MLRLDQFLHALETLKRRHLVLSRFNDTTDAFVALGGEQNKTGEISTERLREVVDQFELTVDIETLIKLADTDGSGLIEYDEFQTMFEQQAGFGDTEVEPVSLSTLAIPKESNESDAFVGGWWRMGYRVKEARQRTHSIASERSELPSPRMPANALRPVQPRKLTRRGSGGNDLSTTLEQITTKMRSSLVRLDDTQVLGMRSSLRPIPQPRKKHQYRFANDFNFDNETTLPMNAISRNFAAANRPARPIRRL